MAPRDSGGIYTLPDGYQATTGETVEASQHNPPLEDLASAMSSSLPRNGAAPMTGPIKLPDGTAGSPALTFASATNWGLYKTETGIALSIGGVFVAEIGGVPSGAIFDYAGSSAPGGYLLCYGQAVSRSTYSNLFAAIGVAHGSGDGSTTFNLPDGRGRVRAGLDNMGGSSANRLQNGAMSSARHTLGGAAGADTHALTSGENGPHDHGVTDPGHDHDQVGATVGGVGAGPNNWKLLEGGNDTGYDTGSSQTGITIQNSGSGTAHNNVQPTMVMNWIIKI